ncbi:unnamed protein product [Pleuronectes platessa]|uniref:Uncharacterized protein n=1 Tax=Pleuronectes platessa TaxID=8262 RepID=A0A9N7U068_PLEPL|nr:unnamed protein product [Pleuronectes platessa]
MELRSPHGAEAGNLLELRNPHGAEAGALMELRNPPGAEDHSETCCLKCHADRLNLEVVSSRPYRSAAPPQPSSQGRSQLVQEVVRLAEEAHQQAQEKAARRPKLSREEREFSQSRTPNLYSLLEEVRELALMDPDMIPQVCASTA